MTATEASLERVVPNKRAGRRWIMFVIILLTANVIAAVSLAFAATHGASKVLPSYEAENPGRGAK